MLVYRPTMAAAALASALLVACADPDQLSDLRGDGPPNVMAVTVMSDLETSLDPDPVGLGRILETATFCRLADNKRPYLVGLPDIRVIQVCPENPNEAAPMEGIAEAVPPAWFLRIVFDRLLEPRSVEDLIPNPDTTSDSDQIGSLEKTQPVVLKCTNRANVPVEVPYDGYYVPNGNRNSWPLGPALFVQPLVATSVPTGATCAVSIKDKLHSKSGDPVPSTQRDYQFKVGAMSLRFSNLDHQGDKEDGSIEISAKIPIELFWTAPIVRGPNLGTDKKPIYKSTVDTSKIAISSGPNGAGGIANTAVCAGNGEPVPPAEIRALVHDNEDAGGALILQIDVSGSAPLDTEIRWQSNTTYLITFAADIAIPSKQPGADGTIPANYKLCFHTSAPMS